jgi:hypothetical protein
MAGCYNTAVGKARATHAWDALCGVPHYLAVENLSDLLLVSRVEEMIAGLYSYFSCSLKRHLELEKGGKITRRKSHLKRRYNLLVCTFHVYMDACNKIDSISNLCACLFGQQLIKYPS